MTDKRLRLTELQSGANFIPRHIGPRQHEIDEMLKVVGADSLDDLIDKVVPKAIRQSGPLDLPEPLSERNTLSDLRQMAGRNQVYTSMIGMGYYGCVTPKVILRNVLENPGWYTAYTPYQAEVSQGRLEALLIFQQMVSDLTGLPRSPTPRCSTRRPRRPKPWRWPSGWQVEGERVLRRPRHPSPDLAVVETRARAFGFEVIVGDPESELDRDKVFGALLSYPGSSGEVRDHRGAIEALHGGGALAIMATTCWRWPADAAGRTRRRRGGRLGPALRRADGLRRPACGLLRHQRGVQAAPCRGASSACRSTAMAPGAAHGAADPRAAHPAREGHQQHLHRPGAAGGDRGAVRRLPRAPTGWRIARRVPPLGRNLRPRDRRLRLRGGDGQFFDTLTVRAAGRAQAIAAKAREQRINLRVVDADHLGISFDETTRREEVERLLACFKTSGARGRDAGRGSTSGLEEAIAEPLRRTEPFLTHPVFRSTTARPRCCATCAAAGQGHRARPLDDPARLVHHEAQRHDRDDPDHLAPSSRRCIPSRRSSRRRATSSCSRNSRHAGRDHRLRCGVAAAQRRQPGRIRRAAHHPRYHEDRGEAHRDVCLIPVSAHGTNPASAVMAGLNVVVVAATTRATSTSPTSRPRPSSTRPAGRADDHLSLDPRGVRGGDPRDLRHRSTPRRPGLHGRRQPQRPGRLVRPAEIGADVCHMNLHKTFCIPHGGGGPGMGPIGVKAHLAPFLPDHRGRWASIPAARNGETIGQVSAAPWGSASILPISWAYIAMMGPEGLTRATRWRSSTPTTSPGASRPFPGVYTGPGGMVAHECIIDLRDIKERRASRWRTSPSGSSTTASMRRPCRGRCRRP
jgi:glycine dehydrogenase